MQKTTDHKTTTGHKAATAEHKGATAEHKGTHAAAPTSKMNASQPMQELFVDMLQDIYWAEKHLTQALPKMSKAATTEELQNAFDEHLTQTEEHVTRLEKAFELIGKKAEAKV
jgi:hypothetical protein